MGKPLPPRVIKAGPYRPSQPRTGDESDGSFRMDSMIVRGRGEGRMFWETYSGEKDLNEPLDMVPLTGTINLTDGSTTVIGVGSLFFSECHLGETIVGIINDQSWLLKPRRIISDTEMIVWGAPDTTITGVTGWRMSRLVADNDRRATMLFGNVIRLDKGSYLGVGDGIVRLDGLPFSASWSLARHLSLNLFDPVTETFRNIPLGMDTPAAPSLAAVGGGTKGMQAGNYSIVITPARKETAGFNNPSLRADVTIATGDMIATTFGAMDTAHLQNAWDVWGTTFADTLGADLNYLNGPWHFVTQVTDDDVSPAGGTINVEWLDAEIETNELVSFNNDAPTDAEFVAMLNNAPVIVSCQGQGASTNPTQTSPGPFICPAKPNNIEAFPLDLSFSSSPPETILGVMSAGQGRLYLLTINHLQIVLATPDESVPMVIRPFWKSGFAGPDQLIDVDGTLYGYPVAGPTRSAGEGDETYTQRAWAAHVAEFTDRWNPGHVILGFDPFRSLVVFIHCADHRNDAGFWTSHMLGYSVELDDWAFDRTLTSDTQDMIVSGIATVGDRLELIVGGRGGSIPLAENVVVNGVDVMVNGVVVAVAA